MGSDGEQQGAMGSHGERWGMTGSDGEPWGAMGSHGERQVKLCSLAHRSPPAVWPCRPVLVNGLGVGDPCSS